MPKNKKATLAKALKRARRNAEIDAGLVGRLYTRVADKKGKFRRKERRDTKRKLNTGDME